MAEPDKVRGQDMETKPQEELGGLHTDQSPFAIFAIILPGSIFSGLFPTFILYESIFFEFGCPKGFVQHCV